MLASLLACVLFVVSAGTSAPAGRSVQGQDVPAKLDLYFRAALNGQWNYSCLEKIQRTEKKYEVVYTKTALEENKRRWNLRRMADSDAAYEYRLRLKGKRIIERRPALSSGSGLSYEEKNFGAILPYKEKGVILNAMECLSRVSRGSPELELEGTERIGDFEARIVHFKSTAKAGERQTTLSGRMWVHPDTGAVWRMSLEPESWAAFASEAIPKEFSGVAKLGHQPLKRALTWSAEYGAEDRGIRFPTRVEITEDYLTEDGERLTANVWKFSYEQFQFGAEGSGSPIEKTNPILMKAGAYCERLKSLALHYVCEERIARTTYLYRAREFIRKEGELPRRRWELKRTVTQEVLNDYQLIKKEDKLEEKRKALEVNGRRWAKEANPPNILPYQAQYIIYGPVGFLSKYWQGRFDYFEEGSEKLTGDRTAVVLTSLPNEFREENGVYGRIWVESDLGAVLRISWDPDSIPFFHPEDVPEAFGGLEKRLVWTAYYEVEKNGAYFPSRQEIREEYAGPAGETVVGDTWTVTYEKYKFFVVSVDVDIKK